MIGPIRDIRLNTQWSLKIAWALNFQSSNAWVVWMFMDDLWVWCRRWGFYFRWQGLTFRLEDWNKGLRLLKGNEIFSVKILRRKEWRLNVRVRKVFNLGLILCNRNWRKWGRENKFSERVIPTGILLDEVVERTILSAAKNLLSWKMTLCEMYTLIKE